MSDNPTAESMSGSLSGGFGGARWKQIFSMRRLEALSNTIFGVAMTLLAYDLPKASRFANAPAWMELVDAYAQPVIALIRGERSEIRQSYQNNGPVD